MVTKTKKSKKRKPFVKKTEVVESGEIVTARKPSKHKKAVKIISENIGNPQKTKEELMAMGYSESYIDSGHMKTTKSFTDILEEYLPDKELMEHHKELLNAKVVGKFDFPPSFTDDDIYSIIEGYGFQVVKIITNHTALPQFRSKKAYYLVPDSRAKKDALDMAFKLKGNYAPEKRIHGHIDLDNPFDDKQSNKIATRITRRKDSDGDTPSKEESN